MIGVSRYLSSFYNRKQHYLDNSLFISSLIVTRVIGQRSDETYLGIIEHILHEWRMSQIFSRINQQSKLVFNVHLFPASDFVNTQVELNSKKAPLYGITLLQISQLLIL